MEDLKAFQQMLTGTLGIVKGRIATGKTLDAIKAEGLPDKWKSWGNGFIKTDVWIDTLYRSATKTEPRP